MSEPDGSVKFYCCNSQNDGQRQRDPLYLVEFRDRWLGTVYCSGEEAYTAEDFVGLRSASRLFSRTLVEKHEIPVKLYKQLMAIVADSTQED